MVDTGTPEGAQAEITWLRALVGKVFVIEELTLGSGARSAVRLRGRFIGDTAQAFARLAPVLRARGRLVRFRRDGDRALILIDEAASPTPNNRWLPIVLAILTFASILATATLVWAAPESGQATLATRLWRAAQFALSLVAILLAHELGHYFMAKRLGVATTLPYLIPFPNLFGTLGAVIRMKDIPPNRRALLLIGAAGPLAGLVVALPILIAGIALSPVGPLPEGGYVLEGNSLLYAALKYVVHGQWLPGHGMDINLHPLASAGWVGLFVTSLNLLPAGQLDGGHAAHALLGAKARYLDLVLVAGLASLGLLWSGWLMWAVLVFVLTRRQVEPLDAISPVGRRHIALALLLLFLFVITFIPLPLRMMP